MLTWRWIGTGGNGFGRSVVSQTTVSVMGKGTLGSDHGSGDPTPVIGRGWRQVRYPCLRVRMMMPSRVDRMMMMPGRRGVRRVRAAPALREALMAGGDGRISGTGSTGGRTTTTGGRGRRCRTGDRVVRLVIRGRTGGTGRSSGSGRGRPKAKGGRGLPVVPGGAGGRGGISRQIVIRRGIVAPVSLMVVQRLAGRGWIVRILRMMRTVTPAALRSRGGRV